MPARRMLLTSASTRMPSSFFCRSAMAAGDLALRIGGERLQVDHQPVGQRLLHVRDRRARGGAEQAERGLGFDRQLDIGQPQRLRLLVEPRPAPDVHGRLGAEAEEALLLLGVHQQRDQQPVAGGGDARALDGHVDRAGTVLGEGLALELRPRPAGSASVKDMSTGRPTETWLGIGGTIESLSGNGQVGVVCVSVIRVSASIPIVRINDEASTFGCAAIARVGRSSSHIGGIDAVPPVPCSGIERQALAHCARALFWNSRVVVQSRLDRGNLVGDRPCR